MVGGLTFCPWCGKEGQNEGTVANHLWHTHYLLGLICVCCLHYFMTSAKAMCQHAHLCKPMTSSDDEDEMDEEDYEDNDNGDKDNEFMFEED